MRRFLSIVNWIVFGLCAFIIAVFIFGVETSEADSTFATLMVVLALTGMIWIPLGFIASILSLWIEAKAVTKKIELLKKPALYVFIFMSILLIPMFV